MPVCWEVVPGSLGGYEEGINEHETRMCGASGEHAAMVYGSCASYQNFPHGVLVILSHFIVLFLHSSFVYFALEWNALHCMGRQNTANIGSTRHDPEAQLPWASFEMFGRNTDFAGISQRTKVRNNRYILVSFFSSSKSIFSCVRCIYSTFPFWNFFWCCHQLLINLHLLVYFQRVPANVYFEAARVSDM